MHLHSDTLGVEVRVPSIHPYNFSQAINVHGVVALQHPQLLELSYCIMTLGSLAGLGLRVDLQTGESGTSRYV